MPDTSVQLSDDIFAELRKIDTPTITNVVATYPKNPLCLGLYNPWTENWYSDSTIRCLYPEMGPIVGYAVTCVYGLPDPNFAGRLSFMDVVDALDAMKKPTILVIQQKWPPELHNKAGGKGGKLAFVESRKRGKYEFPFVGKESETRLTRGALLPMLGAFRWMVAEDEDGDFTWKGSFDDVLELWRETGAELMRATQSTSDDLSRQPNLIGKSRNHWATLHSTVAKRNLMAAAS